jgi:DTW domain-containing protein YfiP
MKRSTVQRITLCISVVTSLTAALSENHVYKAHLKAKIASSVVKGERREQERQSSARNLCSGCQRPPVLCVCEALPSERITTSTHVLILQHPNEYRKKTFSTVPLIPLVLKKCQIRVSYEFEPEKLEIVMETIKKGQRPLLLFPGPDALSLDSSTSTVVPSLQVQETLTEQEISEINNGSSFNFNKEEEQLLILIDGTWAEARRMVNGSPLLLEKCQQVQFTSDSESIYNAVRKEPEKHCLSTLEACAEALLLLEPQPVKMASPSQAKQAKYFLEATLRLMIERKAQVQEMRNPAPWFDTEKSKKQKLYQKNKQRLEKEKELFRQEDQKDQK